MFPKVMSSATHLTFCSIYGLFSHAVCLLLGKSSIVKNCSVSMGKLFFFPLSFHMSMSSGSTLFRFIPQGEVSGSAVLVVTGLLLCPTGNFDH